MFGSTRLEYQRKVSSGAYRLLRDTRWGRLTSAPRAVPCARCPGTPGSRGPFASLPPSQRAVDGYPPSVDKLGTVFERESLDPRVIVQRLLTISKGIDDAALPRRWVVERTFSWLDQNRRMSLGTTRGCAPAQKRSSTRP